MGFIRTIKDFRRQEQVDATLTIIGISRPVPNGQRYQRYKLDGVVYGPGMAVAISVIHRGVAPVAKWPKIGAVLPVTTPRTRPERMVINWDALPVTNPEEPA